MLGSNCIVFVAFFSGMEIRRDSVAIATAWGDLLRARKPPESLDWNREASSCSPSFSTAYIAIAIRHSSIYVTDKCILEIMKSIPKIIELILLGSREVSSCSPSFPTVHIGVPNKHSSMYAMGNINFRNNRINLENNKLNCENSKINSDRFQRNMFLFTEFSNCLHYDRGSTFM